MSQPNWKLVAILGDVDYEAGGKWLFQDTTGVYDPEIEVFTPETREIHRFSIEKCTNINGIVSDNEFHPEHSVWWDCEKVAEFIGQETDEFIEALCSDDLTKRAFAYIAIADYYGLANFDSYPLVLTEKEIEKRYSNSKYKLENS